MSHNLKQEKKRLSHIAKDFSMKTGFNGRLEKYRILTIKENLKGEKILDVGCADGLMTKELSKYFKHITAIDGSEKLIKRAEKYNLKNVKFIYTLFEEFNTKDKFDSVILSDILEHVKEPVRLMKMSKEWVKRNGRILILVPNAYSIHRQIGVMAGLLKDAHDLNATDIKNGHRRVYDLDLLKEDIKSAGLKIIKSGGMFFKPFSNSQMDSLQLNDNILDALYKMGTKFSPQLLAEIYVVCRK